MSLDLEQLVADLPELEPPMGLKQDVLAQVEAEMTLSQAGRVHAGRKRAWLYPVIAMAAATLLMVNLPSDQIPGPGNSAPNQSSATNSVPNPEESTNASAVGMGVDNSPQRSSNQASSMADESIAPLGNVEQMVQKGAGEVVPRVELKMSVETAGVRTRLDANRVYSSGNRIYFRAWVDTPVSLALIRISSGDSQVLKVQEVDAGEHDIMLSASEPLAWEIEQNEITATYVLLAKARNSTVGSEDWSSVVDGVDWTYDVDAPIRTCGSLSVPDVGCAAASVKVTP